MQIIKANNLSVLQNSRKKDLITDPFPYIIIEDALPESLYLSLEREYISDQKLKSFWGIPDFENNKRYQIENKLSWALDNDIYSNIWRDFIRYHSSKEFFTEFVSLFGDSLIKKYHPSLEKRFPSLLNAGVVRRGDDNPNKFITMDVQPGINSPVSSKSSVIGPHVDNKKEIYAGLLYMRLSDDNSIGGNLQIYKHRFLTKDYISEKYDRKDRPNESDLELHATIPYKRNTFVMLLSSNISFHGVSDRGLTKFNRRLVNIISEKK